TAGEFRAAKQNFISLADRVSPGKGLYRRHMCQVIGIKHEHGRLLRERIQSVSQGSALNMKLILTVIPLSVGTPHQEQMHCDNTRDCEYSPQACYFPPVFGATVGSEFGMLRPILPHETPVTPGSTAVPVIFFAPRSRHAGPDRRMSLSLTCTIFS